MLLKNLKGKRPLERPRRRWEDSIKIHLKEMVCADGDWNIRLSIGSGRGLLFTC
jgi:hypothetical protein